MDEIAFFKAIQAGSLSGAYLLHGDEEYSKERALRQCERLVSDAAQDMNLQRLKAPSADAVIAAAETLPFFDRLRVVVVTEMTADEETRLAPYAAKAPDSTLLLLVRRGAAAKTGTLYKTLGAASRVVEFPRCDTGRAVAFLGKRAKEFGVLLDRPVAMHLVDVAGVDMATLENALLKLAAYVGPGCAVTREAIAVCVTPNPEYTVFQMLDRFLAGDLKTGLSMLQTALQSGEQSAMQLASFFEGRMKQMLTAKQLLLARQPEQAVVKQLGGSPYAAKKTVAAAKTCSLSRLRTAVLAFSGVDAAVKTGAKKDTDALLLAIYRSFSKEAAGQTAEGRIPPP